MFLEPGTGGTVYIGKTDLKKFIQVHVHCLICNVRYPEMRGLFEIQHLKIETRYM